MAKQKQTQQTPEQTTPNSATEKQKTGKSNSQQIQDLKQAEFTMNYQTALGKALGPKLYELIAPLLSFEKMSSYASKAIEGIANSSIDWVNSSLSDGQLSKEQEDTLSSDFQEQATKFAKEYLESEDGKAVLNKIQEFIGENPYVVVGVGILAALGAILADMDIPEIKQKFKLGENFTLKGGADIGSLRNIALKSVSLSLEYQTENIESSLTVSHSKENNTLGGSYKASSSDGHTYGLDLESDLSTDGLSKLTGSTGYTTSDEKSSTSIQLKSDLLSGDSSLNYEKERQVSDTLKTSFGLGYSNDGFTGSNSTTFGTEKRQIKTDLEISEEGLKAYNLSGLYQLNDKTSVSGSLGGNSEHDAHNIYLQVKTKSGEITHTGQIKYSGSKNTLTGLYSGNSERLKYGLMLEGDMEGNQLSKVGGNANYSTEGSDYYSASFQSDLLNNSHSLDLSAQKRSSDLSIRGTQGFDYDQDSGFSSRTEVLGAYHMNNDLALIGGAQYDYSYQEGGNILPKIGVQYKNIPTIITFDPKNKSVSIGLTLRF
jgi:hypothetical protein